MGLKKGYSKKTIDQNIAYGVRHGKTHEQASIEALAYAETCRLEARAKDRLRQKALRKFEEPVLGVRHHAVER